MNEWIALLAEGAAEHAILDVLIDQHCCFFEREQLLEHAVIRTRSAKQFQNKYLNHEFDRQIHLYRIIDSRQERFNLSFPYRQKISQIETLWTRPEIEILYIIQQGQYRGFAKQAGKPSEYVKQTLKLNHGNIKSYPVVYQYWQQRPEELVQTIIRYGQITSDPIEKTLVRLLRDDLRATR
ncbi:hypothetical protein ACFQHW_10205 [Lapidilactobacillus achengensis]|uniref:Uncharacterized protein n=1 Tax=Lapidilactobacillus achengensis TaxID=2486000 RepID=A0ABW1UQI8_9LACO|nr:hypothetical protein [Lapidilactobacillus achengensis]